MFIHLAQKRPFGIVALADQTRQMPSPPPAGIRRCSLLLIFLFLALPAWLGAGVEKTVSLTAEERNWLAHNPDKLTLYYNVEFPPIEFASDSGAFVGLGADVVALVEKRLGITFKKVPSDDWNRHLMALESGRCAVAPTIVSTAERQRFAFFTTPYAVVPVVIIMTRTQEGRLDLDDLEGKTVAVVSGYATESYAQERSQGKFKILAVNNVSEGLRAVAFGQADAMLENLAVASHFIDQEGIPVLRVAGNTDYKFAWSIGVSRKYPLLFSAVQKAMDTIEPSEMEAIRHRWISLKPASGMDSKTLRILRLAGAVAVSALLVLLIVSFILRRKLRDKAATLAIARKDLLDQEELFRSLFMNAPIPMAHVSKGGRLVAVNDSFTRTLGYTLEDIPDMQHCWPLVYPDPAYRKQAMESWAHALQRLGSGQSEPEPAQFNITAKNGRILTMVISATPVGNSLLVSFFDVTEQREREAALQRQTELFRATFNATADGVLVVDSAGRISHMNQRFIDMWKIPPAFQNADDDETLLSYAAKQMEDPDAFRRKVQELYQSTAEALEEIRFTDGRIFERYSCPMVLNGQVIGRVWDFRDITQRKRAEAERAKLQEQLLQSGKLEAVGVLAGGVAHDFNNILSAIIGFAEITLSRMDSGDPNRRNLEKILDAALRSADLTKQLLAFARKQTIAPVVLDLNEAVAGVLSMIRRIIGENIELLWGPDAGPCPVRMDPSQIDQILLNLCVNAKDAIAGIGIITIETGTIDLKPPDVENRPDVAPGSYVTLSVSDTGCGMDAETLKHIFDPFFTTKGLGRGTGMGCATVYGIVKQNEGFIEVQSRPGEGALFRIYLPLHPAPIRKTVTDRLHAIPASRGETVLVIEDEPTILEMSAMMLRHLGYGILSASTPGEALQIAREHPADIHLILTDVVMPEMNGRDLVDRLKAIRPELKTLFMSGYTADVIADQGVLDAHVDFIHKPFSIKDLAAKIREVLDG